MNQEIEDFFAGHKLPIAKMIMVGVSRRGLSEASILKAAEDVYEEIKNGKEIAPIRIAWAVYSRAKMKRGYEMYEVKQLKDRVASLEAELGMPWYKKIFRRSSNV